MTGLTIEPEDSETDLLGKTAGELQSGIEVTTDGVYGTLKYVDGYTGFSGDPNKQHGHYLALKFDTDDEDDEITVELLGGDTGHPVTLDSDRNLVVLIGDPRKQKLRVIASHENEDESITTETKILRLTDLTLEPEED